MQTEQKPNNRRAVVYVRLSADDSTNPSFSPMNQEKLCKEYANRLGDPISAVYKDINRSGANIERPGFLRLINDAKKGMISKVFIKDWSRLTRNISDLRMIRKLLEKDLGVEIVSTDGLTDDKSVDISTLSSDWVVQESRKKQEQIHDLKKQDQIPCSRPPFGYKMSKKYKMFIPDGDKAVSIKEIFEQRDGGSTITEIAMDFKMNITTIYNILQNKTYLGFNCYKGEWSKGRHEPLIDEETFKRCQKEKTKERTWKNNTPVKIELPKIPSS